MEYFKLTMAAVGIVVVSYVGKLVAGPVMQIFDFLAQ